MTRLRSKSSGGQADPGMQHPLDWASPRHRRIGLGAQINELAYEQRQRDKVYPRLAASGRKQSELDYHVDCLDAARRSLEWLRDHEQIVRAAAAHDLESLLRGAAHALRSYQHGNAAPDLAAGMADRLEDFIRTAVVSAGAEIPEGPASGAAPEAGGDVPHDAPAGQPDEDSR